MKSLNMDWLNVYGTKSFKSEQYYTLDGGPIYKSSFTNSLVNGQEREKETR
jgi:hypothetical protein